MVHSYSSYYCVHIAHWSAAINVIYYFRLNKIHTAGIIYRIMYRLQYTTFFFYRLKWRARVSKMYNGREPVFWHVYVHFLQTIKLIRTIYCPPSRPPAKIFFGRRGATKNNISKFFFFLIFINCDSYHELKELMSII